MMTGPMPAEKRFWRLWMKADNHDIMMVEWREGHVDKTNGTLEKGRTKDVEESRGIKCMVVKHFFFSEWGWGDKKKWSVVAQKNTRRINVELGRKRQARGKHPWRRRANSGEGICVVVVCAYIPLMSETNFSIFSFPSWLVASLRKTKQ